MNLRRLARNSAGSRQRDGLGVQLFPVSSWVAAQACGSAAISPSQPSKQRFESSAIHEQNRKESP